MVAKTLKVIAITLTFVVLSVVCGLAWEHLALQPCDSPCSDWLDYFVVPWFGPLIGAYGESAYDAMTVEVMILFFLFFMVGWLLIVFLGRKRRLAGHR